MKTFSAHIALILLLIFISQISHAQIKTNVSFSHSYLERAKAMNKTKKEYKRFLKDSLKQIKKLNKHYDFKMDSLMNQLKEEAGQRAGISKYGLDTLSGFQIDSLRNLPGHEYLDYLKGKDSLGYDANLPNKDSLFKQQQRRMIKGLEGRAASMAGLDQMSRPPALPDGANPLSTGTPEMPGVPTIPDAPKFDRFKAGKTLKNNMHKFPKVNLDKMNTSMNKAHKELGSLKKKYVSLPSMNDLKGGLKVNSLKGQPMGQRIKWGGNFTIRQEENTIHMDFSPSIAYRLNKKLSTGIEGMYRTKFGKGRTLGDSFFSADTYGGRIFNEYILLKSIYARTEFETLSTQVKSDQNDKTNTKTVLGAMAGIGNSFTLTESLYGKINIQYNFLYQDDNPVYNSPWIIRFGLEFKKKNK